MIKNLALFINLKRADAQRVVKQIISWLKEQGDLQLLMEENTASILNQPQLGCPQEQLSQKADLVVALGGDGTLLHAARVMGEGPIPILGVNFGSLGFLTEITQEELYTSLKDVLKGDFELEERIILNAAILRQGKLQKKLKALNDLVINNGALAKLINLRVLVAEEYLTNYLADGLITATPTGSTGYSLSAGGPIVCPEMRIILLSPICPHTLSARPMILPANKLIKVVIESDYHGMMLTADGQEQYELQKADELEISWSGELMRLVKSKKRTFFEVLRNKLNWGGYLSVRQV